MWKIGKLVNDWKTHLVDPNVNTGGSSNWLSLSNLVIEVDKQLRDLT